MKVVVVGAGISGMTAATVLAHKGHKVEVFETREQLGGNCADRPAGEATRLHMYGPHIFHTNSLRVWNFLNEFTEFNNYQHRVLANTTRGVIPIPFNKVSESIVGPMTDDQIRDLLFIVYSQKMWGKSWDELPGVIRDRVPPRRDNGDCRYFTDAHQGIPVNGFNSMFCIMSHGIKIHVSVDVNAWRGASYDLLVYTGCVDEYFDNCFGRLEYRTLDIETRRKCIDEEFDAAVINYCTRFPYTRKTDHSYWHEVIHQHSPSGLVTIEYPREWEPGDIPYYPKPFGKHLKNVVRYKELAGKEQKVLFLGRLATYSYLNIDQAVLEALEATDAIKSEG